MPGKDSFYFKLNKYEMLTIIFVFLIPSWTDENCVVEQH